MFHQDDSRPEKRFSVHNPKNGAHKVDILSTMRFRKLTIPKTQTLKPAMFFNFRQNTHSHDTFLHVQLITARTAQMFHSPREHAWLKSFALVCQSSLSSQRHVSHVAAFAMEHFYTISLTYITCLPTILSHQKVDIPTCPCVF